MTSQVPPLLCALALGLVALFSVPTARAQDVPAALKPEDVEAVAKWFDSLEWPDLRDKPYVEIMFGKSSVDSKLVDGPKVRGFLLTEDDKTMTLFVDGSTAQRAFFSSFGWPFVVQKVTKSPPEAKEMEKVVMRTLDLPEMVKALLAELRRPKDKDEERWSSFGQRTSPRTALFVLARCCARTGQADLARELDAAALTAPGPSRGDKNKDDSFRDSVQREIAHALMWKAVLDCNDAQVTRTELLAQFTRIVRDFPVSEHRERATGFVEMLTRMIAEDGAHTREAKPLAGMTDEEKVRELIFQLRDQNGHQWSQPGSCDIFLTTGGRDENTPAHQLVKLGYTAVPALIEALDDKRLTRSVGFHRDFYFSHFVLTVGDCAQAILTRIAGRNFWVAQTTSAAMGKDGQTQSTKAAAEAWWREFQAKGEKVVLAEGVRKAGQDSADQARRLAVLDPSAALEAMVAGIRAAKNDWVRTELVQALADIKDENGTKALQKEMKGNASLNARVAAASELFRRKQKDAVPAMLAEWKKWKDAPRKGPSAEAEDEDEDEESAEALISFLGTCGDVAAMQALADRFPKMKIDVKFKILEVAAGQTSFFDSLWPEGTPLPAEVKAVAEKLFVTAMEDRTVRYGMSGSRNDVSYTNPRVCDMAALLLAQAAPDRYRFTFPTTQFERDAQIAQARNTWRVANLDAKPLPVPTRPDNPAAANQPNIVSALEWSGGPALAGLPLAEGQVLTADAMIESLVLLHRKLPKTMIGFDLTAERAANGQQGFYISIAWAPVPGTKPATKPSEAKPAEAKSAVTKPAQAKPDHSSSTDTKPADNKPAENKPAENKPAENKPAENKPAEAKPAAAKSGSFSSSTAVSGDNSNPGGVWMAGGGWSHSTNITAGQNSLLQSSGGSSFEHRTKPESYDSEKRALAKALAAPADQPISITLSVRLTKE